MKGDPPSRVDAATHKQGGFKSTYFHPPLKKGGQPLNKGEWMGGNVGSSNIL